MRAALPTAAAYSIYTITHKDTGRTYVGMTSSPQRRLSDWRSLAKNPKTKVPLACALRDKGVDQFDFLVVDTAETYDDAAALEHRWIKRLRKPNPGVYNKLPVDRPPFRLVVYLDEKERRELQKAASQTGLALSVFVRALALTAVRRAPGGVRIEPAA